MRTGRLSLLIVTNYDRWAYGRLADVLAAGLSLDFDVRRASLDDLATYGDARPDVLLCLWWHALPFVRLRPRVTVTYIGDLYTPLGCELSAKLPETLNRTDHLIVPTQHHARVLRLSRPELLLPPYSVCEAGVDLQRFTPQPWPEAFAAGWAGTQYSKQLYGSGDNKGVSIIRQACQLAGVPLLLAEPDNNYVPWEQMAKEFYRRISVYICASAHEGAPNALLEAMACARPAISTNVGLAPRLLSSRYGSGQIVERSAEHIAEALLALRDKPRQALAAMGDAARLRASLFGWEHKLADWRQALHTAAHAAHL